jgi:hypothetical protein
MDYPLVAAGLIVHADSAERHCLFLIFWWFSCCSETIVRQICRELAVANLSASATAERTIPLALARLTLRWPAGWSEQGAREVQ